MPTPATLQVQGTQDGPQITVNDMIRQPLYIPRLILDMTNQMFIADQLLRSAGSVESGVAMFYQSDPLFADTAADIIRENAEFPVAMASVGTPGLAFVQKRGLSVRISREMQRRNKVDLVNKQITQVSNTLIQAWDGVFFNALLTNPNVQTLAAVATWASGTANTRKDVLGGAKLIVDAKRGFKPNTLVLPTQGVLDMATNDNTWKAFVGNVANFAPGYTGRLPSPLWGMDVWTTYSLNPGTAILLERGRVGFIADEDPLSSTPLYYKNETQTYRSDTWRSSLVGIDQPLAACVITGI